MVAGWGWASQSISRKILTLSEGFFAQDLLHFFGHWISSTNYAFKGFGEFSTRKRQNLYFKESPLREKPMGFPMLSRLVKYNVQIRWNPMLCVFFLFSWHLGMCFFMECYAMSNFCGMCQHHLILGGFILVLFINPNFRRSSNSIEYSKYIYIYLPIGLKLSPCIFLWIFMCTWLSTISGVNFIAQPFGSNQLDTNIHHSLRDPWQLQDGFQSLVCVRASPSGREECPGRAKLPRKFRFRGSWTSSIKERGETIARVLYFKL